MKRILIAALLCALLALAQDYAGDDDLSWQTPPPPPGSFEEDTADFGDLPYVQTSPRQDRR